MKTRARRGGWLWKLLGSERRAKTLQHHRRIHLETLESRFVLNAAPGIVGIRDIISEGEPGFSINGEAFDFDGAVVEVIYSLDTTFGDADDLVFNNHVGNPNQLQPHPFVPGWYLAYGSFSWSVLSAHGIVNDGPATYPLYVRVVDNLGAFTIDTGTLEILDETPTIDDVEVNPVTSSCGSLTVHLTATLNDPGPVDSLSYLIDWGDDPDFSIFDEPIPAGARSPVDGSISLSLNHTYAAAGTYSITLYVFDDDGALEYFEGTVTVTGTGGGTPPGLTVAPLFSVNEGQSAVLSATVTGTPGQTVALAWDLASSVTSPLEPSTTLTLDGSGSATWNVIVPWSTLVTLGIADSHGGGTYPIALQATGSGSCGGSASATSSLKIHNVAPTVLGLVANQPLPGRPTVTLTGNFTDPGIGDDPFTVVVTWESGVSEVVPVVPFGALQTFTVTHTYTSVGVKSISVSIADDEGAVAIDFATATVNVALAPDGTLSIAGSPGRDSFTITRVAGDLVRVESDVLGGLAEYPVAAVSTIVADLGNGDDMLLIAGSLTQPAVVLGGGGNDVVIGGGGPTVFVGGAGNDLLIGGRGRNILIGSLGTDVLYGGGNQDILVGSATIHDTNTTALLALLAEWNSAHSLTDRVRNLLDGSGSVAGLNGSFFLTPLANDGAVDVLLGGGGTDWIWFHVGDVVLGRGDILNPL